MKTPHLSRRQILSAGVAGLAVAALLPLSRYLGSNAIAAEGAFEVSMSEAEWRAKLDKQQFAVLRQEATERAFTSPLNDEHRAGIFHCAGCDLSAYSSAAKYDSGTGWPSFYESLPDAIGTKEDNSLFATRTEIHCRRCGGHFGHMFDDGPQPTGKRHCLNGVALSFVPA